MPGRGSTLLMLAVLAGCSDEEVDGRFSPQAWAYLQTFRLPAADRCPASLGLAADRCDDAAELGRRLFFDRTYAGPIVVGDDGTNGGLGLAGESGKVSCADCHVPGAWFADDRSRPAATSLGAGWTGRNTPTLVDLAYRDRWFTWDGTYATIGQVLEAPLTKPALLHSSPARLAEVIQADHADAYDRAFDPDVPRSGALTDAQVAIVVDHAAKALEVFQRGLLSGPSPFDRYLDGELTALSDEAKDGLELFIGPALCSECHHGPLFADEAFHNTGVAQRRAGADTAHVPAVDRGRAAVTRDEADEGRFRTPSLRNLGGTAPYLHAGQIATLAGVIDLYRWGGDAAGFAGQKDPLLLPLALSDDDARHLEAFLRALDGTPPVVAAP